MRALICFVGLLVAAVMASDRYDGAYGRRPYDRRGYGYYGDYYRPAAGYRGGRYYYGGTYGGKCGLDGLYYRDDYSFVICSNGNSYVQPCAPGTRNSGYNNYAPGYYYGYSDFCDVNLNDFGYGAGYDNYKPQSKDSYGKNSYDKKDSYDNKDSYGKDSYGKDSYDNNDSYDNKDSYGKDSYGKDSYGKDSYGKDSYGKDSYGKDSYDKEESYAREEKVVVNKGSYGNEGYGKVETYEKKESYSDKA